MKNVAFVQARVNSSRYPRKILKKIHQKTLLEILLLRLKKSKKLSKIVVCTSRNSSDDEIVKISKKLKVDFFRGDEKNVLKRFYEASKIFKSENIVRITSDCPLTDPKLIDQMLNAHIRLKMDYTSNTNPPTFPDGMDIEIFRTKVLRKISKIAKTSYEREHVTILMKKSKILKKYNFESEENFSQLRVTIDYYEDYLVLKDIFKFFKGNLYFDHLKIITMLKEKKSTKDKNKMYIRDEGSKMTRSQKLWKTASGIIPGGTSLFSKNPNLFLPTKWPTYFSKTKDCYVWSIDNKKYLDLSYMGVGTNILGYNNKTIDKAVLNAVKKGNLSTLNSPEEVLLAKKLVELTPWADMVKFTRSGGEANAIALRISRASSKRNKVLFSGYHGWHDWYLAANISKKNSLNNHLMNNVPINGVPKNLSKNVVSFKANDFKDFKLQIKKNKDIGTVFMEIARNKYPSKSYLKKIRKICDEKKIVLIFDECTTGFRECMMGMHNKFKIYPDIAVYGKSLGNGYAINAIVGRKEIMENANKTFISSTFWTERIGFTAALSALDQIEKKEPWKHVIKLGKIIKHKVKVLSKKHKIKVDIFGIDSIPSFKFSYKSDLEYRTFLTQEMLKKNILATNAIYLCCKHKKSHFLKYFKILDNVFKIISKCEKRQILIEKMLKSPTRISGIRN